MRKWTGYILLLLGTSGFGFVSGAVYPLWSGVRGAIIGGVSGLGLILLDELQQKRLNDRRPPAWRYVLGIALASGCLAGGALIIYGRGAAPERTLLSSVAAPEAWQTLLLAVVYTITLHLSYAVRRVSRFTLILVPWLVGLAGVGVYVCWDLWLHDFQGAASSLLLALFAALPLSFGWGFSAAMFDPAFTANRWQRTIPGDE